jgi:hypothetical protein
MSAALRWSVATCLFLQGCSIGLHGYESSSGGVRTTGVSTTMQASGGAGSTRANVGFSSHAAPASTGGQVAFSRGASLLVLFGLFIAGEHTGEHSPRATDAPRARLSGDVVPVGPMPTDRISETCSCYGYVPPTIK